MDFSLNASEAASESRMLKQCRPVSELGEDLHQSDRAVKLARTDSASFIKQELSNAVEDHQMSVYDPHSAMISIYQQQQQQQQQQHQQQMGLRSLGYAQQQQNHQYISSMKHQFGSSGLQFQQQQQQQQFFPFTASQWAELEHQALIFKYMMAKAPVPPELVNPFRRSLMLSPSANTAFQLGVSTGSPMDAEPGRCRRTDGKKWRCSRPIVADQKYCERHIHRGRNRSRKAAEAAAAAAAAATSNNNGNSNSSSGAAAAAHRQSNGNEMVKSAVFDQQSSKNSSSNIVNNNNNTSSSNNNSSSSKFFLSGSIDSGGYALQSASESVLHTKDQRFVNGMSKDQFDLRPEQLLFSEVSGSCTRQLGGGGRTTSVASQFGNSAFSAGRLTATIPSGIPTQNHQNDLQIYGCDGLLSSSSTEVALERKQPEALRHFFVDWPPRASHKDPSWGDEDSAEEQGLKIASCFGATAARKEGILKLALENAAANSSEEDDPDPYTNISLARMSAGSSGGGDLLSDVLKSSPSISSAGGAVKPPPMGFNLGGYRSSSSSQQQQMMILSSPTGVLQKVTCFSDSSSSASSPGSVKNDPNHAH